MTKKWLEGLANDNPKEISLEITAEQLRFILKHLKEWKSASPSGSHPGHWIAALDDPVLLELYRHIIMIPFKHGFAPSRWQHGNDAMLLKEIQNYKTHKLRIIVLLECEKNLGYKVYYSYQGMESAEKNGFFTEATHSNRKGHQAINAVIINSNQIDTIRPRQQGHEPLSISASG